MSLHIVEEAAHTDVGRARTSNEDSYYIAPPVFAVADGMGGAQAGEVASNIAVEMFDADRDRDASPEAQLTAVAKEANRKIFEMARSDDSRAGMGTTFLGAFVRGADVAIGHVGDSRAYRLRDGELERLTNDHSLVEEFVRQGKLTPAEAEVHPQRSIITRALGPEPDVEVETCTYPGRDGDVYALCSDGLSGMVSEEDMARILKEHGTLKAAAAALIDAANEGGGRDNITVVLFRLGKDAMDGDEPDTLSGQETKVGVDATAVRDAVRAADTTQTATGDPNATEPDHTVVPERGERLAATDPDHTVVPDAPSRRQRKARESGAATGIHKRPDAEAPAPPRGRPPPPPRRRPEGRSGPRRSLMALIVLIVIGALAAGVYYGGRQFFFVGLDDNGIVSLYRGLPYDLPLEVSLYEKVYASTVPATAIPARRRERILDHQLRARGDAVDLIRQLERSRTASRVS